MRRRSRPASVRFSWMRRNLSPARCVPSSRARRASSSCSNRRSWASPARRSLVADLLRFGIPATRIAAISNARTETEPVSRGEIERSLGMKVAAEIPPSNQRGYAKSIAALQKYVRILPPRRRATNLQPSAAAPLGDAHVPLRRTAAPVRPNGHADLASTPSAKRLNKKCIRRCSGSSTSSPPASRTRTPRNSPSCARKSRASRATRMADASFEGSAEDLATLRQEIVDEALGLGPLEDLMNDRTSPKSWSTDRTRSTSSVTA